jgi:phosphotransferase system enzyme I (PtsI)
MRIYQAIGVSPGIAVGRAFHVERSRVKVFYEYLIDEKQVPREVRRFKSAVDQAEREMARIKKQFAADFKDRAYILDSHLMILRDPMIYERTLATIEGEKINAEWALKRSLDASRELFDKIQDDYIRSRFHDVEHVGERLLRLLAGQKEQSVTDINEKVIVVAHDLSPADTMQMDIDRVLGFVTAAGGRTSHTAIISRSMEIPAVLASRGPASTSKAASWSSSTAPPGWSSSTPTRPRPSSTRSGGGSTSTTRPRWCAAPTCRPRPSTATAFTSTPTSR